MAGDWLKVEVALPKKPEVWQMAGILGVEPDAVVGKLLKVWGWFDAHTENGHAPGVTFSLIDAEAGVTGFAEAMSFVGWLEQRDRTLVLPHFDRHNGKTAKNRALSRDRKQAERGNVTQDVPDLSRTERDKCVTREEKRREEEDQKLLSSADDPCPHAEILALYHAALPANPRMKVWAGKRQSALRARWREDTKRQSLDYWRRFFAHVAASRFLTGRASGKDGRTFLPGLDWLVLPENFAKVIEGRYHDQEAA